MTPERRPGAIFSECQRYRYLLEWPTGLDNDRVALFVLANPSTATEEQTDPTVARTIAYAKRWGLGWARVVNARAWRETDPQKVPPDPLAIGPENDRTIARAAASAELVVCGWGKLGGARGPAVLDVIRGAGAEPLALKLNRDGSPSHPLYLRADLVPFAMQGGSDAHKCKCARLISAYEPPAFPFDIYQAFAFVAGAYSMFQRTTRARTRRAWVIDPVVFVEPDVVVESRIGTYTKVEWVLGIDDIAAMFQKAGKP